MCRFTNSSARASVWLLLLLLLLASQVGCVRRRMTITSNPPGANVYVDERWIGVTPVSTDYIYYGTRNIQVVHDGAESVKEKHRFDPPWYQYPVIDFFAENLWPFEVRDERLLEFNLPPMKATSPTEVIQRGDQLRTEAQQGLVTPMVQPKPGPLGLHDWSHPGGN